MLLLLFGLLGFAGAIETASPEPQQQCGRNEIPTECKQAWPQGTCYSLFTRNRPARNNTSCSPGCRCIDNYLRWNLGTCIPKEDCLPPPHYNNFTAPPNTNVNNVSSSSNSSSMSQDSANFTSIDGGQSLNSSSFSSSNTSSSASTTINSTQENMNCNRNASYKQCPMACPPSCGAPDAMSNCSRLCPTAGCECNPGYIISNGTCIRPSECAGGSPCRGNRTFVYCKVSCPSDYCPVDDRRQDLCDQPYFCSSGCVCEAGYRIRSQDGQMCILAQECPPLECTRQNEVWNPCASNNLAESCSDIGRDEPRTAYFGAYPLCNPKCVCKEGYYRNITGICVPVVECGK